MADLDPAAVARQMREEGERRDRQSRERDIKAAEDRGREKQRVEGILKDHHDDIQELKNLARTHGTALTTIQDRLTTIEKAFGEFTAVAKALAENGVSNRTFVIGVGMLIVAIAGVFIGVAHP